MITPFGLYEWQRVPFGLCSTPSSFQKIVAELFHGIPEVKNFLDDIIICGATLAEQDERLRHVLMSVAQHDVVINAEKSSFSVEAVDFVGNRVSPQGVSPLQSHVETISKLDTPTSLKELRRLLGAAGFYSKFVPRVFELIEVLNETPRKIWICLERPATAGLGSA